MPRYGRARGPDGTDSSDEVLFLLDIRETKWLLPHQFRHVATADALGADEFGCISPTWQGYPQPLQIWFEFFAG